MKGTLTLSLALKIRKLLDGKRIPSGSFPSTIAKDLIAEDIIVQVSRGSQRSYLLKDAQALHTYLSQHYGMGGTLDEWIEIQSRDEVVKRSELVKVTGNSKLKKSRGFKGFLLRSYSPVEATLNGEPLVIDPPKGLSLFMEDYGHFRIPDDVVVIGVENGENFQQIHKQEYLFKELKVLFVSRYPQSKDLRRWLQMIPNQYIHFGDFDLAGIHIFLTEFYPHLGIRSGFFIPPDVEERLKSGSCRLYDNQYARYKEMTVADERLRPLVQMIHQYRRGYEQEGYII